MSCLDSFDRMCKRIVCPNRLRVNERDILEREVRNRNLEYKLFNINNSRGQSLSCLIFIRSLRQCPTVMYLHGNGGSKLELLPILRADKQQSTNFCSFDFSGCGKSDGDYITYGQNEVNDIFTVMNHLSVNFGIKQFHLWGRSMGATSAILCAAHKQTKIASMILDSPFSKLQKVIENVSVKENFPTIIFLLVIFFIKRRVGDIVNKDIFQQDFLDSLKIFNHIPSLFAYSQRDQVVLPEDVLNMYNAYGGQKKCVIINSNHAQERPVEFITQALRFVHQKSNKLLYTNFGQKPYLNLNKFKLFGFNNQMNPQPSLKKISLNSKRGKL